MKVVLKYHGARHIDDIDPRGLMFGTFPYGYQPVSGNATRYVRCTVSGP